MLGYQIVSLDHPGCARWMRGVLTTDQTFTLALQKDIVRCRPDANEHSESKPYALNTIELLSRPLDGGQIS